MPLKNYAVLKGRPINNRLASGQNPHYQVLVSADGELHRIAINVRSQDGSEVEYLVRSGFQHPITDGLAPLADGLHPLQSKPGGVALDFIRGNLGQPWEFKPLPISASGPDNDLNEKIDAYVQRAMSDENALVYAFGETWGPENAADKYFGFKPGRGIHDIHFNQGNPPGRFAESNGPWQDGGLIFQFPDSHQWVAVFLKFQTQAWHSDDDAGDPITPPGPAPDPIIIPPMDQPDGLIRIMAAYVNDVRTPERERVILLNTADVPVSLEGWRITDKQKQSMKLTGTMEAGAVRVVDIQLPAALSNKGGIITLVNADGVKVHGVAYTKAQAAQPGRTIPF
jgi:uncharacterized protein YukJ